MILEPLHAQISALTDLIDRLIQDNSVRESTMASARKRPPRPEVLFVEASGTPRFALAVPLTAAGYSADMVTGKT